MAQPSSQELSNLSKAVERLWQLDENKFEPEQDYKINLQNYKRVHAQHDAAQQPLFTTVSKQKFFSLPTYSTFYSLLDNYVMETGVKEHVDFKEHHENRAFIREIVKTRVMRYVEEYAKSKGWVKLTPGNDEAWMKFLEDIWFKCYRRESHGDSSAFEHVFVGESRDGQIIGFHNWITVFLAEFKKHLDYKGYIPPRSRNNMEPSPITRLITIQFTYNNILKPISSMMVGVSPEFEVALFTLIYLSGMEKVNCVLDGIDTQVVVHRSRDGKIGTAYVEVL
ncbi:Endoribonuclease XendoU [Paraphysoderma sedebokerense]|nr:Endoribonuclease XendoU [Paraphysoderma sedebokerense]